jgi:hypothetical protein
MEQIDWVKELEKEEETKEDLIDWLEMTKSKGHFNRLFGWMPEKKPEDEKSRNSSLFRRMLRDLSRE